MTILPFSFDPENSIFVDLPDRDAVQPHRRAGRHRGRIVHVGVERGVAAENVAASGEQENQHARMARATAAMIPIRSCAQETFFASGIIYPLCFTNFEM